MVNAGVFNLALKKAIKSFSQKNPHLLLTDKPLANEELEF